MIQHRRKLVFIGATVGFIVGSFYIWSSRTIREEAGIGGGKQAQSVKGVTGAMGGSHASSDRESVEFPSIGRVDAQLQSTTVVFKNETGESIALPFKFWVSERGVWIRGEYLGDGTEYPETPPRDLEGLYEIRGETVVGVPAVSPAIPLEQILKQANERVPLQRASKIVLEHVIVHVQPQPEPEAVVMVKVWGVEKAWPDSPDRVPRVRVVISLDTERGWVDDAL
jgi:hypothetical protein